MIEADAAILKRPLPVLAALAARATEAGPVDVPEHRALAFLLGSPVTEQEHRQMYAVLPGWFAAFGGDLAAELSLDHAGLARRLGLACEPRFGADAFGW